MPAPRRRSCPATARSPICSGRMTHPAPLRPSPVPSISRLFAAAFLAIAVAGLAERVAIWRSARRTQADMIELSQRLEQLARVSPSPALEPEIVAMRELAAEVGDNAIQAAAQTTVIFVIVLVALGVGLGYNRRPLSRDVVRQLVGDTVTVIYYGSAAAGPVRTQLQLATADVDAAGGLALAPLRSQGRLVGLLVATVAGELSADARVALEHAAPNLAIACERESAHQHTRRLAVEVRHAAQRLESQNAELEDQHRELSRLNAELDQAGKLKDQFLANVSHELRTPLNSVIGFSDLLLTMATPENPLTETQPASLDTIARNGRHLLEPINQLLDPSKTAAGRMELRLG